MKFSPISLAKKSTALRILMRDTRNLVRKLRYILVGVTIDADDKIVIFGSYNGKSYACSPKAVYEYMLNEPAFNDYRFVWFLTSLKNTAFWLTTATPLLLKTEARNVKNTCTRQSIGFLISVHLTIGFQKATRFIFSAGTEHPLKSWATIF